MLYAAGGAGHPAVTAAAAGARPRAGTTAAATAAARRTEARVSIAMWMTGT
jgi:hypothetical protein